MKGFLKGLLTTWITILLIVLGIVSSIKGMLINITDEVVKTELKSNIVDIVEDFADSKIPSEAIEQLEKEIESNPTIKNLMNKYYDKVLDVLSSNKANIQIDVAKELESLIDDSEEILKDYGVTLTKEEKQELLSVISSSELNTIVNNSISEIKDNLSDDVKAAIDTYAFATGIIAKVILVGLIAVALLLISLLNKNFYGWLLNFGIASIIAGTLVGILLPIFINLIVTMLLSEINLVISTMPLTIYGCVLLALGIISIVVEVIISKKVKKKAKEINIVPEEA